MADASLTVFKHEDAPDGPRASTDASTSNTDEEVCDTPIPLRKDRHLNVDEVLARSLPKVFGEL
jgi:hypothetical protein